MPNLFFVYGTLKRGQCRERSWPCEPQSVRHAWTRGALFSRSDYPALRSGDNRILGECWEFDDAQVSIVLRTLDAIEGTHGNQPDDLYHRFECDLYDLDGQLLGQAMAYYYVRDPLADGFVRLQPDGNDAYVAWPASV